MNVFSLSSLLALGWLLLGSNAALAVEEDELSAPPAALSEVADEADADVEVAAEEGDTVELMEADTAIEIAEFEEPQSGGLGLWSAKRAGLPYDLWQNLPEKDVLLLLPHLPQKVESPAIRKLMARFLVMETTRSDYTEAVLMARVEQLLAMGQASLAKQMLEAVPSGLSSEPIEKQLYLLKVLSGESQEALCKEADDRQTVHPQAFWQRYQVLCQAMAEKKAKAHLGLELLREQNNAPDVFDDIIEGISTDKPVELELKTLSREELSWVVMAKKLPKELPEAESIERLALVTLHEDYDGEWRKQAKRWGVNLQDVDAPRDDSPDIALSTMQLDEDATPAEIRKALLALALRRVWDKPVPVETEDALLKRHFRGELTELSTIWREAAGKMQNNNQRLAAVMMLLGPITEPLTHYTAGDIAFLVQELQALGLPGDAAALSEEALSGE